MEKTPFPVSFAVGKTVIISDPIGPASNSAVLR